MKVLLAGASGMIGRAALAALKADGHEVARLVRRPASAPDEISWNPSAGEIPSDTCRAFDAVVNLCGAPIGGERWTAKRRNELKASRIDATQTLGKVFGQGGPRILVNSSAVGIYGDRGNLELFESSQPGDGFLAGLCRDWEDAASAAGKGEAQVVCLRFGMVLSQGGGALERMIPFFRAGLGAPLGSGRQWVSWVSLDDAAGAICFALSHAGISGPINVVSPNAVTNAGFTRALGRIFGRQWVLAIPRFALKAAYGPIADEVLLASAHVVPSKLLKAQYPFRYSNLEDALYQALALEKAEP
jgi:uncharacterized protein (TIGR01777 family)